MLGYTMRYGFAEVLAMSVRRRKWLIGRLQQQQEYENTSLKKKK